MTRRQAHPLPPPKALIPAEDDNDARAAMTDETRERILSRPDGWYWLAPDGRQEVGPFATLAEAAADMDSGEAGGWVPGESLAEAESELGLGDWIDPDSGELAEGQSTPHLRDE